MFQLPLLIFCNKSGIGKYKLFFKLYFWNTHCVLYVLTSFLSIKITTRKSKKKKTLAIAEKSDDSVNEENNKKDAAQEAEESMEMMTNSMNYMFPIMAITISFVTPLGLALYWLVSNVLIIIERLIIDRISEKIDKKEDEKNNA